MKACIYSINAMKLIIDKAELTLKDTCFDSTEYQFIRSERYSNNIAMNQVKDTLSQLIVRKLFSPYRKQTIKLNSEARTDRAVFCITTNNN
jgi:hypothetical protein